MRKPRRFSHSPIYIDERRDRLAEIERRAREELEQQAARPLRQLNFRQSARQSGLSNSKLIFLIAILLLVGWLLFTY